MNNYIEIVKLWIISLFAINIDLLSINKTLELIVIILTIIYSCYKLYLIQKNKNESK